LRRGLTHGGWPVRKHIRGLGEGGAKGSQVLGRVEPQQIGRLRRSRPIAVLLEPGTLQVALALARLGDRTPGAWEADFGQRIPTR
jgi:hypothetical protein